MKYRTLENKVGIQQYWIGLLVSLLLLFVLENTGFVNPLRRSIEKIAEPSQELGVNTVYLFELPYRVTVSSYNSYQKIQNLEMRYGELASKIGDQESLRAENEELRRIAQASTSSQLKRKVIAPIIGYSQPVVADVNHDFQMGDPAFIVGVFIGRVSKVTQNQAQLQLFSQLFSQPILAKTESGSSGLVFGNGRDVLLQEVPIEKELTTGEHIFTVGQEGILPNWYIGRVKEIQRHEGSPTQSAIIDQGVSFFESKMVEIK